jgi:integrase/recombinase XerD
MKLLAGLGEKLCQTPEAFKAWSQNLGHDKVLTTFHSYGEVQPQRQGEIIRDLNFPRDRLALDGNKIVEAIYRKMAERSVFKLSEE